ncbi:MAG: carboxypeptidase regulatory-like domain-containing protein [Gemmatirosa sp.]
MPRSSSRARLLPGALALCASAACTLVPGVRGLAAQTTAAPVPAPAGPPVRLVGTAWDSLARAPLAGALIQLAPQANPSAPARTAVADSLGRWQIDSLPQGSYLAGYFHPTLDELGFDPPTFRVLVEGDSVARLDIGLPGARTMRTLLCGKASASDSTGAIIGVLRDAEGEEAIAGATLSVAWRELVIEKGSFRNTQRRVPVAARGGGLFVACGVPTDTPVELDATAPGRSSGILEIQVPRQEVVRRDVLLGDSASVALAVRAQASPADTTAGAQSRGVRIADGARLTGRVTGPDGKPLPRAQVLVSGIGRTAVTGAAGTFALDSLPSGTFGLDVRALGLAPVRIGVDLTRRRPANVVVALRERATALSTVVVRGQRSRQSRFLDEFLERKRRGTGGTFLGQDDLERRGSLFVSDVLRTVAGMRVLPGPSFGQAIRGRGGCTPAVYIDGMPVIDGADDLDQLVNPSSIMAMEVYTGLGTLPAQFGGMAANGCGAVVVWTKR